MRKHRREGKNIIYVDETYGQQSHSVQSCWQSEEEPEVLTKIGTGQRLIIVQGGGHEGLVEDAFLIFKSGKKKWLLSQLNEFQIFFCKWLDAELLPKLESLIIIIMDNAKFHNVEIDKKLNTASPCSYI